MTRTERLDAFTDAAFAFAISLMVIGGEGVPKTYDALLSALAEIPSFAFGFAVMAMFWWTHVRWRKARGEGGVLSVLLTLLLLFLTLVYVQPLRAMAVATGKFFTGYGSTFGGDLLGLFGIYGTGFVLMALTVAALWLDAARDAPAGSQARKSSNGEVAIWLVLALTGIVSVVLSLTRWGQWSAMVYMTTPVTIFLLVRYWDWGEDEQQQA